MLALCLVCFLWRFYMCAYAALDVGCGCKTGGLLVIWCGGGFAWWFRKHDGGWSEAALQRVIGDVFDSVCFSLGTVSFTV